MRTVCVESWQWGGNIQAITNNVRMNKRQQQINARDTNGDRKKKHHTQNNIHNDFTCWKYRFDGISFPLDTPILKMKWIIRMTKFRVKLNIWSPLLVCVCFFPSYLCVVWYEFLSTTKNMIEIFAIHILRFCKNSFKIIYRQRTVWKRGWSTQQSLCRFWYE